MKSIRVSFMSSFIDKSKWNASIAVRMPEAYSKWYSYCLHTTKHMCQLLKRKKRAPIWMDEENVKSPSVYWCVLRVCVCVWEFNPIHTLSAGKLHRNRLIVSKHQNRLHAFTHTSSRSQDLSYAANVSTFCIWMFACDGRRKRRIRLPVCVLVCVRARMCVCARERE